MSQIDFAWILDGFTMNLRFDIGGKCRGLVEPFFPPVPKGDIISSSSPSIIGAAASGAHLGTLKVHFGTLHRAHF